MTDDLFAPAAPAPVDRTPRCNRCGFPDPGVELAFTRNGERVVSWMLCGECEDFVRDLVIAGVAAAAIETQLQLRLPGE